MIIRATLKIIIVPLLSQKQYAIQFFYYKNVNLSKNLLLLNKQET